MSRELRKENDVKLKKYMMFAITVFLLCSALVAPALAIEESEVESAIAASSREEVLMCNSISQGKPEDR